jgi:hypothetical protein
LPSSSSSGSSSATFAARQQPDRSPGDDPQADRRRSRGQAARRRRGRYRRRSSNAYGRPDPRRGPRPGSGDHRELRQRAQEEADRVSAREQARLEAERQQSSPSCATRSADAVELAGRIVGESLSDDARSVAWSSASSRILSPASGPRQRPSSGEPAVAGYAGRKPRGARRGRATRTRSSHRPTTQRSTPCPELLVARLLSEETGSPDSPTPAPTRRPAGAAERSSRPASAPVFAVLLAVAGSRWSSARDLVDGVEIPVPRRRSRRPDVRQPRRGRGRAVPLRPDRGARPDPGVRAVRPVLPSTTSAPVPPPGGQGHPVTVQRSRAPYWLLAAGRPSTRWTRNQAAQRRQREIAVVRVAAPRRRAQGAWLQRSAAHSAATYASRSRSTRASSAASWSGRRRGHRRQHSRRHPGPPWPPA